MLDSKSRYDSLMAETAENKAWSCLGIDNEEINSKLFFTPVPKRSERIHDAYDADQGVVSSGLKLINNCFHAGEYYWQMCLRTQFQKISFYV